MRANPTLRLLPCPRRKPRIEPEPPNPRPYGFIAEEGTQRQPALAARRQIVGWIHESLLVGVVRSRREPARNRMRFYAITATRTLFVRWAVVREWGRIGQAGTVRETGFATETAAIAAGAAVRRRKEKRSYPAVNGFDTAG